MPDEPTQDRPRRRPVLLAMLAAAAVLVALAGSGLGSSGSANSGSSKQVTPAAPAADQQAQPGLTHRGRQCHHDGQNRSGQPPV